MAISKTEASESRWIVLQSTFVDVVERAQDLESDNLGLVCLFMYIVCKCVHICMQGRSSPVCGYVEARCWRQVPSSIALSALLFETGSVSAPVAHWLTRLAGHQAPRSLPALLLPQLWGYRPEFSFHMGARDPNRSLCIHSNHFTHSALSPAYQLGF